MIADHPPVVRISLTRRIAADPTSTALLLAGPSAMELWPGLRRVAAASGRVVVEAEIRAAARAASVRALPPRRTPTAFVTRFEWAGPGLPATTGELSLTRADSLGGAVGTQAELVLTSSGFEGTVLDEQTLTTMADGFLTNLAEVAERRSDAA